MVWNTSEKSELIPHDLVLRTRNLKLKIKMTNYLTFEIGILDLLARSARKGCNYPPKEGPAAYQLVGGVMAYQGYDG